MAKTGRPRKADKAVQAVKTETANSTAVAESVRVEFTGVTVKYQQPTPKPKKLYWAGLLPGPYTFEYWTDRPANPKKYGIMEGEPAPHWRGLCAHFQQLSMKGKAFPSFETIEVGRDASGDPMLVYRPGTIMKLDADEIDTIKKASVRNFVREKCNADGKPIVKVGSGEQYNIEQGEYLFDANRDYPFAHYIYVEEIKSERDIPTLDDFIKNPPKSLLGD